MSAILEFKGEWRIYQKRVLLRADNYLKDGKIHIVAAPGSGKTTLGIELIGRLDKPSLILAPSITIREQWIERIKEGFLKEGVNASDWITNNLKSPNFITVATYQALHSAMTRFHGKISENTKEQDDSDDTETVKEEEVDYSDFELIIAMKNAGLDVICLDECHHLRSEWWTALENFRKSFANAKVISLTATPPYDSTPAMWKRYIDMCGDIDEEITIPELVKEGSLCPHQDYVIFNYPTREEKSEIEKFKLNSENMLKKLMVDKALEEIVISHKGLFGGVSDDSLLEDPSYLSAVIIYLQAKQIPFPKRLISLLGAKKLPDMEPKWMERLLQGILYDDTDSYACDKVFVEQMIKELKSQSLIEKKKVCMTTNAAVEKMLVQSKGKIESIKKIVAHEFSNLGQELRLLILTDYIRKECEKNLGNAQADMNQLGVLPFFEVLRRETVSINGPKPRLGVLCGTMVIIPADAKEYLIQLTGADKVVFSKAGSLPEDDYLSVRSVGDAKFLTAAVTELFSKGYVQVLIGTKSLLGEGWDAPCINSLILASFVGAFMLSNQMRGRAIRIDKSNPDKTSNIWHLVCILPPKDGKVFETGEYSEDYLMLSRRMEHFLGLHYEEETIENGVGRLSIINSDFTKKSVDIINQKMFDLANRRHELKGRWKNALAIFDKMEVVDEIDISENLISIVAFFDAMKATSRFILIMLFYILANLRFGLGMPIGLSVVIISSLSIGMFICLIKGLMLSSPLKRLKVFGNGVRVAMLKKGLLSNENCKIEVESELGIYHAIYLKGGTGREKADFANIVSQVFDDIDNQRYILVNRRRKNKLDGFFVVPEVFSRKKEDAQIFAECMKAFIGKYELVYTRNETGRKLLLEGRIKAIANRENRLIKKKKVKGALE